MASKLVLILILCAIEVFSKAVDTVNSDPETVNSDPKAVNSDPKTINSDLKTINSDLKTINSDLKTINSDLKLQITQLIKQSYSCYDNDGKLPPMKSGEVNNNYSPNVCGLLYCINGYFYFEPCPWNTIHNLTESEEPENLEDPTKPFPECCNLPTQD